MKLRTKPAPRPERDELRRRFDRHARLMRQRVAALQAGDTATADALRVAMAEIDIQARP